MEAITFSVYKAASYLKHQLSRIPNMTWILLLVLLADLSAPGYLKFNFVIAKVDLSGIVDVFQGSTRP